MSIAKVMRNGFFAALALLSVLLWSAFFRQVGEEALQSDIFRLGPEVQTLISGDSHSASSIDPKIFPRAANIAEPSENYLFTYYKLRHFLEHNPQIDKVVLAFSYHNGARVFSERYLFDARFTGQSLPRYYPLLGGDAKRLLRSRNSSFLVSWLKFDLGVPLEISRSAYLMKAALGRPLQRRDIPFFGGYYAGSGSRVVEEDIAATLDRHYFGGRGDYAGASSLMEDYLYKIVELCRERGIELYLFNSPLYTDYRQQIPKPAIDDFVALRDGILAEHAHVTYLDYAAHPLERDYFGDITHLNTRGAERLSLKLAQRIYEGREE